MYKKGEIFPESIKLEECSSIAKKNKEFSMSVKNDLIVFNYKMGNVSTFPNPFEEGIDEKLSREYKIRREMRGLIFSEKTKELICRPFHKFFNVNELDETDEHSFPELKDFSLLEKLDGGFACGIMLNDRVYFASKTGIGNKNQRKVEKFVESSKINYYDFVKFSVKKGYTPIFEHIETGKIRVVKYKKDDLILIAMRNIKDGNYLDYESMKKDSEKFGVPCVKVSDFDISDIKTMPELVKKIKNTEKEIEGYCVRFPSGEIYKLKTLYYLKKGKGNADLAFQEHFIWRLILSKKIDDFKAGYAKKMLRKRIDRFSEDLMKEMKNLSERMTKLKKDCKDSRIDPIQFCGKNNISGIEKTLFMMIQKSDDIFSVVKKFCLINSKNSRTIEPLRSLLNDIRFY